ncbi:MAG: MarR family transcriptional regulator [Betaproteobacteria bacterium]|nr:MarR family transcriptional regulator [Betaproteobacteria bacterium]
MARKPLAARKARSPGDFRHENLGRLLIESFRYFRERTLINLRAHGFKDLNPVHAAMLRRVDEGGNHVSDIAVRMGVTKQAAAQLVARVEELGYVTCRSDPDDSRKKTVLCTARGKRFLGSLEGVVSDSVQDIATIIGDGRLRELEETLKLIAARGRIALADNQRERVGDAGGSVGAGQQARKRTSAGNGRARPQVGRK